MAEFPSKFQFQAVTASDGEEVASVKMAFFRAHGLLSEKFWAGTTGTTVDFVFTLIQPLGLVTFNVVGKLPEEVKV